jgi:hypothetical protein
MALDATQVRVGVTGAAYVAPDATNAPDDATTALHADYEDVGYIHEDGVTETHDTDSNDIRAWQNGDIVRKVQTSHDLTYTFTMLETNAVTLGEFYGNFTEESAADNVVEITGEQLPHRSWVLSVLDGGHVFRIVIEDGQVTERGDVVYQNGDAIGREVTITCYPVDGVKATIYMAEVEDES